MNPKMISTILTLWVFAFFNVAADSEHTTSIVYVDEEIIGASIVTVLNDTDKATARSTAAGQHHYKASTNLQWSVGSGFAGNESALSFGLGLQAGSVFVSGNLTGNLFSDDSDLVSDLVIGLGASGEF